MAGDRPVAGDVFLLLVLADVSVRGARATTTAAAVAASPTATSSAVSGPPANPADDTAVIVLVVPIVTAGTPGSPPDVVADADSSGAGRCSGTVASAVVGTAIPPTPPSVTGAIPASGGRSVVCA